MSRMSNQTKRTKQRQLVVRVETELSDTLAHVADQEQRPVGNLIRKILVDWAAKHPLECGSARAAYPFPPLGVQPGENGTLDSNQRQIANGITSSRLFDLRALAQAKNYSWYF
jgi:hypothetical protein